MPKEEKFCMNCGAKIPADAEICPVCGTKQPPLDARLDVKGKKWFRGQIGEGIISSQGFFKSFFKNNIPTLNSYSDIYNLAFEYVSNNKNEKSLRKILNQAVMLNIPITKEDVFSLHFISAQLLRFRQFKDAKVICNRILETEPGDYQAIALLLNIAIDEKDRIEIISNCNRLLECDYLNHVKELQPTLNSSIPEIRDSIKRMADTFHSAGIIFTEMNEFKKAMRAYEIAFEIDPAFIEAHHNIGIMLYKLKRYSEAIKYFEKDIELVEIKANNYPNHPKYTKLKNELLLRIYFNIGKSYFRLNQLTECKRYLGKSVVLDEKNKNVDEAINELLLTIKHDPEL